MRHLLALPALIALAACGAPNNSTPSAATAVSLLPPTPAAVYCQRRGGQVIARVADGRRADLCRMPNGRTVRAADLLNSHNNL